MFLLLVILSLKSPKKVYSLFSFSFLYFTGAVHSFGEVIHKNGIAIAEFEGGVDLAIDAAGNIFVSNATTGKISIISPEGKANMAFIC